MKGDPVTRSDQLDEKMAHAPAEEAIKSIIAYSKRSRTIIKYLSILTFLGMILVIGVAFLFVLYQSNKTQLENNRNSLIAACESGNEFRKTNLILWDYILALPTREERTEKEKKEVVEFQNFINKTFAPRDCNAIK